MKEFGRFPWRNVLHGRTTTEAEAIYEAKHAEKRSEDRFGISTKQRVKINEILAYWYPGSWDRHSSVSPYVQEKWFFGGPNVDREITDKFAGELRALD